MIKQIINKNKILSILSIFLSIVSCGAMVYAGYSLTFLFNTYNQASSSASTFVFLTVKVSVIWVVALILYYLYNTALSYTLCKMRNTLRETISDKIVNQSYEEYVSKDTGNQVSWLTNDVELINNLAFANLFGTIENIATAIFSLYAMIKLSLYIGIASIILFFFISLLPQLLSKKLVKYSTSVSSKQEIVLEKFKEQIEGFVLFLSTNNLLRIKNKINTASSEIEDARFKFERKQAGISSIIMAINVLGQIILIVLTIFLAIKGLTNIGAVLSIATLSNGFFKGVGEIAKQMVNIKSARPIFKKFESDSQDNNLNNENYIAKKINNIENINNFNEIKLSNVSYGYDDKLIIKNIDMNFKSNGKYAVVGQSGSEKSTIAKLIMGFLTKYDGNITIDDKEIKTINMSEWYDNIAYIDQSVFLFTGSVRENLTLDSDYDEKDIWNALKSCQLDDYVKSLDNGLESIITEKGKNMSGGQKQRMALARALLKKPKIIIMDEGTSALDTKNSEEIENNILSLQDVCTIIITHHLREEMKSKLSAIYDINAMQKTVTIK